MTPPLVRRTTAALLLGWCFIAATGAVAAEPFAGQRELLQQQLSPATEKGAPRASALVVARWGDGGSELLLLGQTAHGGAPLSSDSVFELGSVTKALTGSLLAQLAAQGRLGLDDPVARWVPELAGRPAGDLTLRSMATHRTGLPRVPMSVDFVWSMLRDPDDPYLHYSEVKMLSWLQDWKAPTQTEFGYSNLGFALLGLALERAAGQPLARLMETEILRPAGAAGAGLDAELAASQIQGYDERGRPTPAWSLGAFAGAGGLRANATQMVALLDAARHRRTPFDAGADREQARRHASGTVGLGWLRTEKHGEVIVWHNGGTGGFRSFFGYSELSGRAVLLMANGAIDLDSLGMHLINPAFAIEPAAGPRRTGSRVWIASLLVLVTLTSLAWRAWRPRSRLEQALELSLGAAMLAYAWRTAPTVGMATLVAVVCLALTVAGLLVWRGRHQAVWPARRRTLVFAVLNALAGLLVVIWLW